MRRALLAATSAYNAKTTMNNSESLTIATFNPGKLTEYRRLLSSLGIRVVGLDQFPGVAEIDETGDTFEENARLKAMGYARQTGGIVLADDSGLIVDALQGRPGVHSARYGGTGSDFAHKIRLLLEELRKTGDDVRQARFVCEVAIAGPNANMLFGATGICEGTIAREPRGSGGFGYDPIFVPNGYKSTFGELSPSIKSEISHRARAFSQIIPYLRDNIAALT